MDKIFIKLNRLSILGGLFNGGHIVLLSLFIHLKKKFKLMKHMI